MTVRRCVQVGVVGAVAVLVEIAGTATFLPTPAQARASMTTFTDTFAAGPEAVDDACFGAEGVLNGTGRVSGRLVQTASSDTEGRATEVVEVVFVYRISFPTGEYVLSNSKEHKALLYDSSNGGHFNGTVRDFGTLYDPDGQAIGREIFHGNYHGVAVDGQVTVTFDRGRVTCH